MRLISFIDIRWHDEQSNQHDLAKGDMMSAKQVSVLRVETPTLLEINNFAPETWWLEDDPFLLGPGFLEVVNC